MDAAGAKQWRKNYGGSGSDYGIVVFATTDGGFVLYGDGNSYTQTGMDTDLLIYKVDSAGAKQWRRNYGGDDNDYMIPKA